MRLDGQHAAVFVAEGFEDLEFWVTVMRLREEGARITVAGLRAGETYTGKHGLTAVSDVAAGDLRPEDFAKLRAGVAGRLGPVSVLNFVTRVRVLFKFAYDFGLIDLPVRYGSGFDRPAKKLRSMVSKPSLPRVQPAL